MKRALLIAAVSLLFAAPAEAHRWSYDRAYSQAWWHVVDYCGGGNWMCDERRDPLVYGCTEHSWCWPYLSQHQYSEHHKYEFWRDRRCHVIGKSYHGTEYRTGGDYCGPEF